MDEPARCFFCEATEDLHWCDSCEIWLCATHEKAYLRRTGYALSHPLDTARKLFRWVVRLVS